jgi:hypothetical protein
MWRATMKLMTMAMRVAGDKEGEVGKAMAMVKRMWRASNGDGDKKGSSNNDEGGGRGLGQWQGQQEQW